MAKKTAKHESPEHLLVLIGLGKPKQTGTKAPEPADYSEKSEKRGGKQSAKPEKKADDGIKKSGSFQGHSNKPGMGGRSRQLESKLEKQGESKHEAGAVAGMVARKEGIYSHGDFKKGPSKGKPPKSGS